MSNSIQQKITFLEELFSRCSSNEQRYELLMNLGRRLPPFRDDWKIEANQISGCQSILYLHSEYKDRKIFFWAYSDALISAGLAAILLTVYDGATPQEIITTPPLFLERIGILGILSPSRSNGLAHLHAQMKRRALICLSQKP